MSYDFILVRVEPRPARFPSPPPQDNIDAAIRPLSGAALATGLEAAGFAEGTPGPGGRGFQRRYADGGTLGVSLDSKSLYLSTHADWDDVLELYRRLLAFEPELLILDPQKVVLHDAESFKSFSEESYRKLVERFPDRAR